MRRRGKRLTDDLSGFISYYAKMQPIYITPAGTEFIRAYVEYRGYQCAFEVLALVASDPVIPLRYMAPDVIRLPSVKWATTRIYEQTMAMWFLYHWWAVSK